MIVLTYGNVFNGVSRFVKLGFLSCFREFLVVYTMLMLFVLLLRYWGLGFGSAVDREIVNRVVGRTGKGRHKVGRRSMFALTLLRFEV